MVLQFAIKCFYYLMYTKLICNQMYSILFDIIQCRARLSIHFFFINLFTNMFCLIATKFCLNISKLFGSRNETDSVSEDKKLKTFYFTDLVQIDIQKDVSNNAMIDLICTEKIICILMHSSYYTLFLFTLQIFESLFNL